MNAKETAEETVAEVVFPDDFEKDFTGDIGKHIVANSDKGLRVELEG